jgi:cytidylate kinase
VRSSADRSLSDALDEASVEILDAVGRVSGRPVIVVIDGRSGAGKTTLAARLRESAPMSAAVLGLDDVYPGWDGLAAGSDTAVEVLRAVREGRVGEWTTWDWARDAPGGRRALPHADLVIAEGSGLLTPHVAAIVDVRVWVEAPAGQRRDRALRRDGETYRPHWEQWAAQEETHLAAHEPASLAELVFALP